LNLPGCVHQVRGCGTKAPAVSARRVDGRETSTFGFEKKRNALDDPMKKLHGLLFNDE
jgi:hypothetical protein